MCNNDFIDYYDDDTIVYHNRGYSQGMALYCKLWFPSIFIVYHHDMSGKGMERGMVISAVTVLLPLSSKYDYYFNR